ncbi:MAG: hypothetical protein ACI865_003169, partial [Flavobacteriaceae bacterium]
SPSGSWEQKSLGKKKGLDFSRPYWVEEDQA